MSQSKVNKKQKIIFFIASILLVGAALFVFNKTLDSAQMNASLFPGLHEGEGDDAIVFGLCLEDGDPTNTECEGVDCSDPAEQEDNPKCISQAEAGTWLMKHKIDDTGLAHTNTVSALIIKYVNFALPYLALAAFLAFIVAGFFYVTAFGNEDQLEKAKKAMIFAAAGILIVIISYAVVSFVTSDLVDFLNQGN